LIDGKGKVVGVELLLFSLLCVGLWLSYSMGIGNYLWR